MRKWWWWFPGFHKKGRLEKARIEALSSITGERVFVELMAQRVRPLTDPLDGQLLARVLDQIKDAEGRAKIATDRSELDDLADDAELQGCFASYFCPAQEIQQEAALVIAQLEGWGVPRNEVRKLRDNLDEKLESIDPQVARGALGGHSTNE